MLYVRILNVPFTTILQSELPSLSLFTWYAHMRYLNVSNTPFTSMWQWQLYLHRRTALNPIKMCFVVCDSLNSAIECWTPVAISLSLSHIYIIFMRICIYVYQIHFSVLWPAIWIYSFVCTWAVNMQRIFTKFSHSLYHHCHHHTYNHPCISWSWSVLNRKTGPNQLWNERKT